VGLVEELLERGATVDSSTKVKHTYTLTNWREGYEITKWLESKSDGMLVIQHCDTMMDSIDSCHLTRRAIQTHPHKPGTINK